MSSQELHPRTAIINKTQKNQSKKAKKEALDWLAATFDLFNTSLSIVPLSKGIIKEILNHPSTLEAVSQKQISRSKIREAVVLFTRRIDYLTCLKAREIRMDLQENPTTRVTEEEAERA